jgi:hypothetical protein
VNTFSYLINKFFLLGELVPHNEKVVETHGMELESVFEEPGALGFPLSKYAYS